MNIFILQKYIQIFLKSSNYSFVPFGRLIVVFVYAFCFTDLPAKPAQNSKQSAKGYERIIQEILRRPGYFRCMNLKKNFTLFFQCFFSFIWFACFLCFALFFHIFIQEYTEEFRDIAGKSKKLGGPVTDQGITLINQRHVGDDLPVILFTFFFILILLFVFYYYRKVGKKSMYMMQFMNLYHIHQ